MDWLKDTIDIQTRGKGLYPFTDQVARRICGWQVREGMCYRCPRQLGTTIWAKCQPTL